MIFYSRLYNFIIKTTDKRVPHFARNFWEYEAGPKTIFFWAPMCKWVMVIAGISDLSRPAELLSIEQATSLAATAYIASRFSMVITPKNYTLFSVNIFVAITQTIQLFRALNYKHQQGELFNNFKEKKKSRKSVYIFYFQSLKKIFTFIMN
ncbi:hypothetical protein PVAND_009800 [Polypedilum vanderplanki]|uniref:Mitochondrial pyruvate carrier n=1 Tax=Polypedilum vanderplanki TaxID=319348 RepID=A0A9J6CDX4_POLVA|nr:hypothetical protein PVAND_009800 [Polypedilum vanderplanki]